VLPRLLKNKNLVAMARSANSSSRHIPFPCMVREGPALAGESRLSAMARRHNRDPIPIQGALDGWIRRRGLSADFQLHALWYRWTELVGGQLARRSRPRSLRRKVLTVVVASSAWANEMSFIKDQVVAGINERLGAEVVGSLRVVTGKISHMEPPGARGRKRAARPGQRDAAPVPPDVEARIRWETARAVDDPDLQRAIVKARLAHVSHAPKAGPPEAGPDL